MARRRASPTINSPNPNDASIKLAIAGAIFAVGIGVGVSISTLNPTSQSVDAIRLDELAPSREFCNNYGSSAIVTTGRIYVTLNPFSVYVSQVQSNAGCVVLPNNWNLMLQRGVISDQDIRRCKDRMNTFGFVGNLDSKPIVDCVYESTNAQQQLRDAFKENPQNNSSP